MDEDIEEKINELTEKLQDLFGDKAKVIGPFSGKSPMSVIRKAKSYMMDPIVEFTATRIGTGVQVKGCDTEEAYNACVHIITHCLHLFPKDMRNDMLFNAIEEVESKYDKGMLYMEDDEDEDEDE